MSPLIAISVINDLYSDQRVHRNCLAWLERGYDIILIGRKYSGSQDLDRPYMTHRFKCIWNRGPLFYVEYQIRLWNFLRKKSVQVYMANDLDTLLPNLFWSYRRKLPLVYDSHEYFLGSPEIESRPIIKFFWSRLEKFCLPRVDFPVTVNNSIARQYHKEYGHSFDVIRNVPVKPSSGFLFESTVENYRDMIRKKLSIPLNKMIWIIQGAGINIDRGAEELMEAAISFKGEVLLLFVGSGDAIPKLKAEAKSLNYDFEFVRFIPRQNIDSLREYTFASDIGFSLDKSKSKNYQWSLPNKIFDYWHAGIPVVASNLIEISNLINQTGAGILVDHVSCSGILEAVHEICKPDKFDRAIKASKRAALSFNWENEKQIWNRLIDRLEGKKTINIWSMDRLETTSYGGTLEVIGQVKNAIKLGFQVVLYCWSKGEVQHQSPESIIGVQFQTLKRNQSLFKLFKTAPYIVSSRNTSIARHKSSIQRGKVIINGVHCSGIPISENSILRIHNPEGDYYKSLGRQSKGLVALYFFWESMRLKFWERKLAKEWSGMVWALTNTDLKFWTSLKPRSDAKIVGPLVVFEYKIPESKSLAKTLLVPGKFSVNENENALKMSLNADGWDIIWAGHGLSKKFKKFLNSRVSYIENPTDDEISDLFKNSHATLIHAEHNLGIKIKLIQALHQSRWIIAHNYALVGIPFSTKDGILTYSDPKTFIEALDQINDTSWNKFQATELLNSRKFLLSKIQGSLDL
ncbi:MAG: glycosyltransferase [Schleiferiaceae bacterium]